MTRDQWELLTQTAERLVELLDLEYATLEARGLGGGSNFYYELNSLRTALQNVKRGESPD